MDAQPEMVSHRESNNFFASSKKPLFVIVFLILALFLSGGIVYYVSLKNTSKNNAPLSQKLSTSPLPQPSPSSTSQTPLDTTIGWDIYVNTKYHYMFKYPNLDWWFVDSSQNSQGYSLLPDPRAPITTADTVQLWKIRRNDYNESLYREMQSMEFTLSASPNPNHLSAKESYQREQSTKDIPSGVSETMFHNAPALEEANADGTIIYFVEGDYFFSAGWKSVQGREPKENGEKIFTHMLSSFQLIKPEESKKSYLGRFLTVTNDAFSNLGEIFFDGADAFPIQVENDVYVVDRNSVVRYSLGKKGKEVVYRSNTVYIVGLVFLPPSLLYITQTTSEVSTNYQIIEFDMATKKTRLVAAREEQRNGVHYIAQSTKGDIVETAFGDGCGFTSQYYLYVEGKESKYLAGGGDGCSDAPRVLGFQEATDSFVLATVQPLPKNYDWSAYKQEDFKYDSVYLLDVGTNTQKQLFDLKTIREEILSLALNENKDALIVLVRGKIYLIDLAKGVISNTIPIDDVNREPESSHRSSIRWYATNEHMYHIDWISKHLELLDINQKTYKTYSWNRALIPEYSYYPVLLGEFNKNPVLYYVELLNR